MLWLKVWLPLLQCNAICVSSKVKVNRGYNVLTMLIPKHYTLQNKVYFYVLTYIQ